MSLREEMWKYEQITGESAEHVPIIKLGAFLDGYEMGLKALEQQPSEDCISREEAIDIIYDYEYKKDMRKALMGLPSVTPKTRWIPCSERLPEEDGFYLATCDGEICGEDEPIVSMAEFENGKWADDEDDYQCVLAWMPLPEPYKAESEDKE